MNKLKHFTQLSMKSKNITLRIWPRVSSLTGIVGSLLRSYLLWLCEEGHSAHCHMGPRWWTKPHASGFVSSHLHCFALSWNHRWHGSGGRCSRTSSRDCPGQSWGWGKRNVLLRWHICTYKHKMWEKGGDIRMLLHTKLYLHHRKIKQI